MTEEGVSKKPDQKTKDKKADGKPGTKAKKSGDGTPTPEGQKLVNKNYRQGWDQIWKKRR